MEPGDRAVYEKILASFLAAGESDRLTPDDFLASLLGKGETESGAYLAYEYLRGRTPAFAAFLVRELGYRDEEEARRDLWERYGERVEARARRFEERGR